MAVVLSSISDLIPDVLQDVPGATDPEILMALKNVSRKFLDKTEFWEEELEDMDIVASQRSYTPTIPYDANIKRILWVKAKTISTDDFDLLDPLPEEEYELDDENVLYFSLADYAPTVAVTDGLRMKVVLVPNRDCLEIPERIFNDWFEGIVAGAKADLASSPKKPYTNPKVEADNRFLYNSCITKILAEKRRNNKVESTGLSA